MLPTTVNRVPNQTCAAVNEQIRRQTEENISRLKQAGPTAIARRLEELDAEWDVERAIEANAATASIVGGWHYRPSLARFCCNMRCKVGARRCRCLEGLGSVPPRRLITNDMH